MAHVPTQSPQLLPSSQVTAPRTRMALQHGPTNTHTNSARGEDACDGRSQRGLSTEAILNRTCDHLTNASLRVSGAPKASGNMRMRSCGGTTPMRSERAPANMGAPCPTRLAAAALQLVAPWPSRLVRPGTPGTAGGRRHRHGVERHARGMSMRTRGATSARLQPPTPVNHGPPPPVECSPPRWCGSGHACEPLLHGGEA